MSNTTEQSNFEKELQKSLDNVTGLLAAIDSKFNLIVNMLADVIEQDDNAVIHSFDGSMVRTDYEESDDNPSQKTKTL